FYFCGMDRTPVAMWPAVYEETGAYCFRSECLPCHRRVRMDYLRNEHAPEGCEQAYDHVFRRSVARHRNRSTGENRFHTGLTCRLRRRRREQASAVVPSRAESSAFLIARALGE